MNKQIKTAVKAVIVVSSMAATNEVIGYHANPYKSATAVRLMCNIAGISIGFFLGSLAADKVIEASEKAIKAYKGDEEK